MFTNSAHIIAQPAYGQAQPSSWIQYLPRTTAILQKHNGVFYRSSGSSSSSSSKNGELAKYGMNNMQQYQQPGQYIQNYHVQVDQTKSAKNITQPAKLVVPYACTFKQLYKNGYPVMDGNGVILLADTKYVKQKEIWLKESQEMRTCCRCNMFYQSSGNGNGTGLCRYHPKGKKLDQEGGAFIRECCQEVYGLTDGCKVNTYHVTNQLARTEKQKFIETPVACGRFDKRNEQVYAIDCEMVYTVSGPALARLTVVGWNEKPVLDCLVRPPTRVLDTNEEFSGIKMEDLERATDTLETCRRRLSALVNEHTILVGHSLESDLKALRLIHYNVVDTALLFKSGEYKIGLKKLALDYLGLAIQSNNPSQFGHDSEEDARVSLQLLKYKMYNNNY